MRSSLSLSFSLPYYVFQYFSAQKTASENALPKPGGTLSQCCPNDEQDTAIAEALYRFVCKIFRLAEPRMSMNEQRRTASQVQQPGHDAQCNASRD